MPKSRENNIIYTHSDRPQGLECLNAENIVPIWVEKIVPTPSLKCLPFQVVRGRSGSVCRCGNHGPPHFICKKKMACMGAITWRALKQPKSVIN